MAAWCVCRRAAKTTPPLRVAAGRAFDQVDIGIVLLDAETRAEFINRAFRDYFALPDEIPDGKPPFIALMYHGATPAFRAAQDELGTFIAQRMQTVRIGDATPININFAQWRGAALRLRSPA